jgi:alpha-L-fucosidase
MKSFTKKMSAAALLAAWVSVSPLASEAAETKSQPVITQPVESKAEHDARMAWWREAKFGMFIHWGVYAALAGAHNGKQTGGAGEWILNDMEIPVADYKAYSEKFNPVNYTPEQWVIMAKKAGMKYIVLVQTP